MTTRPLNNGTSGSSFLNAIRTSVLPRLRKYDPQILFLSAGFDAHRDDPLADMTLESSDFAAVTKIICDCVVGCCFVFGGWISFERLTFECPGACSCVIRYFLNYITSLLFILLIFRKEVADDTDRSIADGFMDERFEFSISFQIWVEFGMNTTPPCEICHFHHDKDEFMSFSVTHPVLQVSSNTTSSILEESYVDIGRKAWKIVQRAI